MVLPRIRYRRVPPVLLLLCLCYCCVNVVLSFSSFSHHHETAISSTRIPPRRQRSSSNALHDVKEPTPTPVPSYPSQSAAIPQQCTDCGATFPSRTALFKHLRFDNCCDKNYVEAIPVRHSVALFFGYTTASGVTPESAGKVLLEAFLSCGCSDDSSNHKGERQLISSTQSSIAKSRHGFLQQDANCPAGMDTLVVNYLAAPDPEEASDDGDDILVANLQVALQKLSLDDDTNNNLQSQPSASSASPSPPNIVLHGLRTLDTKRTTLHAEHGCTQHVEHFMVPAAWLPDSDDIVEWYLQSVITGNLRKQQQQLGTLTTETPPSLKRFKDIVRSVESVMSPTITKEAAKGRFRTLAYKVKRPWHNYCDPTLRASPNHDVTRRIVDRARFLEFVFYGEQLFVVYEFRGDEFLSQQVRRIVGAAVGMVHGWLPENYMETSLLSTKEDDSDVVSQLQETPLAPTGYLYQAAPRFHHAELCHSGVPLFDIDKDDSSDSKSWSTTRITPDPMKWIQQQLLSDMTESASLSATDGNEWLVELRDTVAPRICVAQAQAQLLKQQEQTDISRLGGDGLSVTNKPAPEEYAHVLKLLQDIVANGEWPETSEARSKVIMGTSMEQHKKRAAGSFTVVDEAKFHIRHPPRSNALFPELAAAVFQLQASINDNGIVDDLESDNQTSSHCAVNCNAQFTPHVDSGRGAGQSLSTIVGLGEYRAGEIVVEGDAHDIRYRPLQFDGWKLRHWTRPFSGERFSLVWFTPEGIERKRLCL